MRRAGALIVLLTLALTGCSVSGVFAFDRAQVEEDIPDIEYAEWGIERDSARLLVEEDGVRYFAARGDGEKLCLVQVSRADPDAAAANCGTGGIASQVGDGPKVELVVPDMGERPGWRKLASNLYAED